MKNESNDDEHPDVFGPFFPGMKNIHNGILEYIKKIPDVNQKTIMLLLQCNFAEYVIEDHDRNYEWKQFYFNGDRNQSFAIGFNRQRLFSQEDRRKSLITEIVDSWKKAGFQKPLYVSDIQDVRDLEKPDWEMILSVHFYFDSVYNGDNIPDTQYFKIVYTHSSLMNNLEKIKQTV